MNGELAVLKTSFVDVGTSSKARTFETPLSSPEPRATFSSGWACCCGTRAYTISNLHHQLHGTMSSWSSSSSSSSMSAQMDLHLADTYISIPLGIFIGLLASFIQSLGLTIQRKSHVLNQQLPEHEQRVEHRRPCVNSSICCGQQFTKCCMFLALNPLFWTLLRE